MNLKLTTRFLIATLFMFSIQAFAEEQMVDEIMDVDQYSLIEIKHVHGEMKIVGWDKNQVKVVGRLGERTEEFIFERKGKSVVIEVEVENGSKNWNWPKNNDSKDDLIVHVPMESTIDYHAPNADLNIDDVLGGVDIDMINGDLRANNLAGKIRLKTVNGDINANELNGVLTVDTVNGDVRAEHLSGEIVRAGTVNGDVKVRSMASDVQAETVNGDIQFILQDVIDVNTSTVNGEIDMEMNLLDGAVVRASTVGGRVTLAFQDDVQAKFSLEAHAGGSIVNRINDIKPNKAKYGPRRWLDFSNGNPTARVDASTVNGRITVKTRS
jgi:DUF4097 and DUF4098 domain-containing protein YvlB